MVAPRILSAGLFKNNNMGYFNKELAVKHGLVASVLYQMFLSDLITSCLKDENRKDGKFWAEIKCPEYITPEQHKEALVRLQDADLIKHGSEDWYCLAD